MITGNSFEKRGKIYHDNYSKIQWSLNREHYQLGDSAEVRRPINLITPVTEGAKLLKQLEKFGERMQIQHWIFLELPKVCDKGRTHIRKNQIGRNRDAEQGQNDTNCQPTTSLRN